MAETKEKTRTIVMRKVPEEIHQLMRERAGGRGLTTAEYVTRLVGLHGALTDAVSGPSKGRPSMRHLLQEHGLETRTV